MQKELKLIKNVKKKYEAFLQDLWLTEEEFTPCLARPDDNSKQQGNQLILHRSFIRKFLIRK